MLKRFVHRLMLFCCMIALTSLSPHLLLANDPCDATDLGVKDKCNGFDVDSNLLLDGAGATTFALNTATCPAVVGDVAWYKFTMPAGIDFIRWQLITNDVGYQLYYDNGGGCNSLDFVQCGDDFNSSQLITNPNPGFITDFYVAVYEDTPADEVKFNIKTQGCACEDDFEFILECPLDAILANDANFDNLFADLMGLAVNPCNPASIITVIDDFVYPGACGGDVDVTFTATDDNGTPDTADDIIQTCSTTITVLEADEPQPPTQCWETATFNDSTCLWVVTGMQENEPPTQCWETAMFNDSTCLWVVTGMQENEPPTECWETVTFNDSTCLWVVTGMQENEPPTECWETATFNDSTCLWVVTGMQENEPPVVNCWDDFVFYTTTCMWGNIGTQEPEPPVVNCWDDFVFNSTTCMWDNTGTIPLCDDDNCATNDSYDTTACECIFTPNPLVGCTDTNACNYDSTATCDDGSCEYGEVGCTNPCDALLGCTNTTACNYNSLATCDDGSCISIPCNLGCTDPCAPNYDELADADDGSCEEYTTTCNTDCTIGNIEGWDSASCSCVIILETIYGCTDYDACNFDSDATCNDDSCDYGVEGCPIPCNAVLGCTNAAACNFNPLATCSDDSCILPDGCTDQSACNYDATALCDNGSCNYGSENCDNPCDAILGCTDENACNYNNYATCNDGSCILPDGCTNSLACNYDPTALCDNGNCDYGEINCDDPCSAILGCTDENACNYDSTANCDDDSCISAPCNAGCTDPCASNYNPLTDADDGSCETYDTTCNTDCSNGDIEVWDAINCGCVVSIVTVNGCTDETACNYDAVANCSDGSCEYGYVDCDNPCNAILGCTDENACNYNPMANCDDDSCILETACDADACTNGGAYIWDDATCDCVLDEVTISGCTDENACNYNPMATCDDDSCISAPCNAGCTDPCATNYDPLADADDGSCEPYDTTCNTNCALGAIEIWSPELCACIVSVVTINGCTDEMACNYDALANCNDGSCEYGDIGCDNPCNTILGCTDENACNYNPMATCDDDSCMSAPCNAGCTDPCAANYDELADGDDGSCIAYDITCDNQCELTEGIYDYDLCDCVYTPIVCDDNDDCTNDYFSEGFCACVYEEVCGLITGAVFLDENENDLMDGNDGVIGISVYLYDESDNLMAQTVTDSNGEYSFTQIVAGNYYVSFNIPSNYTIVTPNIGNNNEIDSDINSNGTTPLFSLSQGQTITGINAGIIDEVIDCDNFAVSVDVICYDENYEIIIAFIGGATNEYTVFNVQTGTIVNTTEEFLALGPFDFNTGYHYNVSLTNNSLCMSSFMQATIDCISTSVELLDFIGSVEETGNLLKWATASEENNDYFKLMRSTDGINFEEINRQDGAGNSQITLLYEYLDQTAPLGISYYRLDQVDWDGTETSSDIIALERTNQDLSSIHVWPNPATNILNIQYNSTNELPTQLFVYNTQGQLIKSITQESIEGVNNITLNTEAFAAGLYFVEVQTSGTNIQLITFIRK